MLLQRNNGAFSYTKELHSRIRSIKQYPKVKPCEKRLYCVWKAHLLTHLNLRRDFLLLNDKEYRIKQVAYFFVLYSLIFRIPSLFDS